VSGNVSLYNETNGRAIHPTPVVGAVGLVQDVRRVPKGWHAGDTVFVAGGSAVSLAGSGYQALFGEVGGSPPPLDLDAEARLVSFLWRASSLCTLVHDAAEGGLAVSIAEAAIHSGCGAKLDLALDAQELFGETGGRAVLACRAADEDDLLELAEELAVPLRLAGSAGGGTVLGVELERLREAFAGEAPPGEGGD
jgi:phosphoribosylformylglycinamidine synthase